MKTVEIEASAQSTFTKISLYKCPVGQLETSGDTFQLPLEIGLVFVVTAQ